MLALAALCPATAARADAARAAEARPAVVRVDTARAAEARTAGARVDTTHAAAAGESAPRDSVRVRPDLPPGLRTSDQRRALKRLLTDVGRSEIPAPHEWQRRKRPRLAMAASALVPGLGQVYNGRRLKVAVMVGAMSFYAGNIVLNWKKHQAWRDRARRLPAGSVARANAEILADFHEENAIDFMWWTGAAWLLGVVDAWIDAHLYDVRAFTPPVHETTGPPETAAAARYVGVTFSF